MTNLDITPTLLRQAVHEVMEETRRRSSEMAVTLAVAQLDLIAWLSTKHQETPWYRAMNRQVERYLAQRERDQRKRSPDMNAHLRGES